MLSSSSGLESVPAASRLLAETVRYWQDGGVLMGPLCVTAFLIAYQYLSLLRRIRLSLDAPERWDEELLARLRAHGRLPDIVAWLRGVPGATPCVAQHALARLAAGLDLREAYPQCRDAELAAYFHSFYVLGALVVVAPLLGLLGTVLGMIGTFDAVAMRSEQTGQLVARGISQALITTQVGLVAALPGTFGLAHLYRLFRRLRSQLDLCESQLYMVWTGANGGTRHGEGPA